MTDADPYPARADGSPHWAAMDLPDLVAWYDAEVRPRLAAGDGPDVDPDSEHPPYRWTNAEYPGFVKHLQREHGLSPAEFYRRHVGVADEGGYDWGVADETTVDRLSAYVAELREVRGHPPTTWRPVRSRLSKYAAVYADEAVNDRADLLDGLRDEDRRPAEIDAAFTAFTVLDGLLGTPASKRKYVSDVRRWYRWLVDTGWAAYNPVVRMEQRLNLDAPEWDNPALAPADVRALAAAAEPGREALLVVGLAGWGLRPSELAALHRDQLHPGAGEDDRPHVAFADGERKNGPGTVSVLVGRDCLADRLAALAGRGDWNGYAFPSSTAAAGHVTTDTLRRWFAAVADRAGVAVAGERPTPKHARRFWYSLYGEAARAVAERYELAAEAQGSASAAVVVESYLSEDRRRAEIRGEMADRLREVFEPVAP